MSQVMRERVRALVARELAIVEDPVRRAALAALLVEPRPEERDWGYGEPGERIQVWVVAECPDRRILLAWSDRGFGPQFPWGFLFADEPDAGIDSQWNWWLEEAFVRSGLWEGAVGSVDDEAFQRSPEERFGWTWPPV